MRKVGHPEVLSASGPGPPLRLRRAGKLFDNENLDLLAHLLDDAFRIPGTSLRFGLDGIVGLIPGLGDILGGLASCILLVAAWVRGAPYVTLARMVVNIGIEVLLGAVPLLGAIFDVAWKANRRNYRLLERHLAQPRRQTLGDWLFLLTIGAILLGLFLAPAVLLLWLVEWLRLHL